MFQPRARRFGSFDMTVIRKYREEDKDQIHNICIETSSYDLSKKNMKEFLFLMYSDYYLEKEPEFCFVACDENEKIVGYILCAKDFKHYYKTFKSFYLPKIDKLGFRFKINARSEILAHALFCKTYKAHLHIDLTENCRRKGVGTSLMDALKNELVDSCVHSLVLSCADSNKPAENFYKKNNFKTVLKILGSNIMACNF